IPSNARYCFFWTVHFETTRQYQRRRNMRRNLIALSLLAIILTTVNFNLAFSQTPQQPIPTSVVAVSSPSVLAEDTPVRLRITQTISSGTAKLNDKVDFEVVEDVKVGDITVIPQGGTAIATVTEARS